MKKEIHLKARIERVENNVNKLAWDKAQHEDLVKLEDRIEKLEMSNSDFHETPKQRWMRENLRPGEVYAGIVLDLYGTTGYDYHLIVGVDSPEYMPATIREFQLINMNVNGRYAFVRRIPVE